MTNEHSEERRDHRFLIGVITGSVLAVGAMVFGPRVMSGLREQVVDSARGLRRRARGVRDDMCDVVTHGAQEVERYATDAKTAPAARTRAHATAHHPTSARQARSRAAVAG